MHAEQSWASSCPGSLEGATKSALVIEGLFAESDEKQSALSCLTGYLHPKHGIGLPGDF